MGALPDKGERLRTQVKELEEALDSLTLTAASQQGISLAVKTIYICAAVANSYILKMRELLSCLTTVTELCKSFSDSQTSQNSSSDDNQSRSQVNPFSRPGGAILLPAPPAPGPSQHQASSQGYTRMYGGRLKGEIAEA